MNELILHGAAVFMGFFAIMNPIANTPIFLGMTRGNDRQTVKAIAFRSVLVAFVIICVFAISGKLIFELFGITLYALRITGGILVFQIGFHMLQGHNSAVHSPSGNENSKSQQQAALSIAVSPLAMPILAGPGTIATAMNFASTPGNGQVLITIGSFAVLCLISYFIFISGEKLVKSIGPSVMDVITKMMGLILAVIGVQMLIEGIHQAIKAFS